MKKRFLYVQNCVEDVGWKRVGEMTKKMIGQGELKSEGDHGNNDCMKPGIPHDGIDLFSKVGRQKLPELG
jgi:hypothetical protein